MQLQKIPDMNWLDLIRTPATGNSHKPNCARKDEVKFRCPVAIIKEPVPGAAETAQLNSALLMKSIQNRSFLTDYIAARRWP